MNNKDIFNICLAKKLSGGSPAPTPTYEDKTLTPDFSNGDVIVNPDEGYDALSSVTIEKDSDLVAENIKKDVEVFGITGTLESGIPVQLQSDMDAIFNKKFGTSTTYPSDTWADTVNEMGVLPTRTASGSIASFTDGADNVPLVSHNVTIEPVQSGTGDPSPSNVRPISGHSSVTVSHSGEDTSDPTTYTRTFLDSNDDPITVYDGSENLKTGEGVSEVEKITEFTSVFKNSTDPDNYLYYVKDSRIDYSKNNKIKCSCAPTLTAPPINQIGVFSTTQYGGICYFNFGNAIGENDIEHFLNYLYNIDYLLPLATPIPFHTDPLILDTLEGVNNIWADTGDTAVEYRADIDLLIAELEG